MKENGLFHDNMIDKNWVLKRKRKRFPASSELSNGKDGVPSINSESSKFNSSAKRKPKDSFSSSQSPRKKKGHDGYYYECVICDLGGNLLCCDSCPRTYHLQCLNPPLKRTPPGKWQCPNCCEKKDTGKHITHAPESVSRRARSKISITKSNSGAKSSVSEKLLSITRSSILGKNGQYPSKSVFTNDAPPLGKKSNSQGMESSNITKSPQLLSSDKSEENPFLPLNEVRNSSRTSESDPEAEDGSATKKLVIRLRHSVQKAMKKRQKFDREGHLRKTSESDNGKSIQSTFSSTGKSTHRTSSISPEIKLRKKRSAIDRHKSKEDLRMPKLAAQEEDKCFLEEISNSMTLDGGAQTDKTITFEENIYEEVLQVDRILGCRIQRLEVDNHFVRHIKDNEAIGVKDRENIMKDGSDVCKNHVGGEKASAESIVAEKVRSEGTSSVRDCLDEEVLVSTDKSLGDQVGTTIKCDMQEESVLNRLNIVQVNEKLAEKCNDMDDANMEPRSSSVTENKDNGRGSTEKDMDHAQKEVLYEFFVKWVGRSHVHNTWVSESQLKVLAKRKLENYKAKYGTTVINICQEQWCRPYRVIAFRLAKNGKKEVLIKWQGLSYDECTWERLDQPVIKTASHLISEFENIESQTWEKDSNEDGFPKAKRDENEIVPLAQQPQELKGGLLFAHQLEALNWLRKCWHKSKNVILADEMGLGKTVSACAFISSLYIEFKAKLPCLVLVPLSTMPNWVSEFASWTPHLNVVEYHGSAKARSRIRQYEWHASEWDGAHKGRSSSFKFNVLLTTYEMVLADSTHLRAVPWEVLVVDEGHRLKNSGSKLFSLLNTFSFQHRVLLTGTPLQNNIGEMYNLLNFLQPVSFPSLSSFEEKFTDLTTAEKVEELKKLVAPHMLRRLKKDAMQNIPPKTERMVPVELTSIQAEYYRAMLTKNYQILRNMGKGVAHQSMLNIVMQLRKVCNHPYLIPGTEPESGTTEFLHEMRIKASAKLTLLHSMLKILHKEGHRVLIFSQMTKLLDILEDYLTVEFGPRTFERVDGSVSVGDRQAAIARFNQDKSRFVFLLSTRSCGLGINLATADTVIIYDSDFNPHADIQAMNRAHRIGQSNRLLVYRLVVRASVEERILQLAKKKLMLDQLFVNKSGSQKEVEDILKWGTEELFRDSAEGDGTHANGEASRTKSDVGGETEHRHRRRGGGGLGDVYKDKCTEGSQKTVWDENAILKLLDRSNLELGTVESTDGDLDNDMLGSVKSVEWNEEPTEEQGGTEFATTIAGDVIAQTSEKKNDLATNVNEENEWDRLLRVRWEKYQNEEEAALGRGKRQRKTVSYKEVFTVNPSEALSESGNDDEEAEPEPEREPEYTPAGRALKAKFAKLRARQKERLAQRHVALSCLSESHLVGSESLPYISNIEVENHRNGKCTEALNDEAFQVGLKENVTPQTLETTTRNKNDTLSKSKFLKHIYKPMQSTFLDLSVKPPGNLNPDIFPSCQEPQVTNSGGTSLPPATIVGPILGLCAPNAYLRDLTSKNLVSYLDLPRSSNQIGSGMRIPEFPIRLGPSASTSIDTGSMHESPSVMSTLPDMSGILHRRQKWAIEDISLSYSHCVPPTSQGRVAFDRLESLGLGYPSIHDKLPLPTFIPEEKLHSRVPFLVKDASSSYTSHFASLSLETKIPSMTQYMQDFPTLPVLPDFHLAPDVNHSQPSTNEIPPLLSLGQIQPAHPSLPESHKKVLDSILMRTGHGSNKFKKRLKVESSWSEDELDALWIGVRRHGRGNWESMLRDPKLKFSKFRTSEDLLERWAIEQLKILDVPNFLAPQLTRPSFPTISDGMMTRALFGSRFTGVDGLDCHSPPKFHSHLKEMPIGYGGSSSSVPHVEPTDHLNQTNEQYPVPVWKPNKLKEVCHGDSSPGPSDRPGISKASLETPFLPGSSSGSSRQREDEQSADKYLKLPSILDESLNRLRDNQNNLQGFDRKSELLPDIKKPNSGHSPVGKDFPGDNSSASKLPHWLREAVSSSSKPPEPALPPTVSAIAQSVRLLYGGAQPTIPPFTIPGPPPFQPKDPRKSLKKVRRKLRKLQHLIPEVGTSSSIPPAPPFPILPMSTSMSLGSSWVDPSVSLPTLNLSLLNTSSSSTLPTKRRKPGLALSPSPEVLNLVASCVAPGPGFLPSDTPAKTKGFEHFEPGGEMGNLDLIKGVHGKEKETSLPLGDWGKLDRAVDRMESGDSSKTHSDACEVRPQLEEISSEETVSDDHNSEQE